jgi:glycosyltransferase involved in cell wall biosynthesis
VGVSLIDRVLCFRRFLSFWLEAHPCRAIQFRSIFEGFPLLQLTPRPRLIFEVNGLPSIELKYRYPRAADDRELMNKIIAQEHACLAAADRIVTPSAVTRHFLNGYGGKTRVIPNGVDTGIFCPAESAPETLDLLYFGTLASWQGVELAVRALAQVVRQVPARITVLGVGKTSQRNMLGELAAKLGIAASVDILPPVDRIELAAWLRRSFAVLAPLPANDRNTRQGCCPLKILEGMAAGVPVIASDLPVVRELGEHDRDLLLVRPGSVDEIAAAVLRLHADPQLRVKLASNARKRILANYTWDRAGAELRSVWEETGIKASSKF